MTIEEWTTLYVLRFGVNQADCTECCEGEREFLHAMSDDVGREAEKTGSIYLIRAELKKRGELLPHMGSLIP